MYKSCDFLITHKLGLNEYEVKRECLNPLDLCTLSDNSIENDAQMIADLLSGGGSFYGDPYWDISGKSLLSGLVAQEMSYSQKKGVKSIDMEDL